MTRRFPHILLVSMPWAPADRPSLAIGALLAIARSHGFDCKSTYPNLHFSALVDYKVYEYFTLNPSLIPLAEHLFAVDIFGKDALDSDNYLETYLGETSAYCRTHPQPSPLRELRDTLIPAFLEQCADTLINTKAEVIGFSCTFTQVMASLAMARRIKSLKADITILFGGGSIHDSIGEALAEAFQQYVDHVFTGEADLTFVKYLTALKLDSDITQIPGVTDQGKLHNKPTVVSRMDVLPLPNYDDYFSEHAELLKAGYNLANCGSIPYETSRGCWWGQRKQCVFCGLNNKGITYRRKSTEKITDDIMELSRKYNSVSFVMTDNILDYRAHSDLLPKISKLPVDLRIFYGLKVNAKRDYVAKLANSGVINVHPGIESFSDHVLTLMRKGQTALQNVALLKWFREYKVLPTYWLITGFPGERNEDYDEIIELIKVINHLPPPEGAGIVNIHRFSPLFERQESHGIERIAPAGFYKNIIPPDIIDIDRFAYFYERELSKDTVVVQRLEALNGVIAKWQESRKQIVAKLGAGFIEVEKVDGELTEIEILDKHSSLVFLLADHPISIKTVDTMTKKIMPEDPIDIYGVVTTLLARGFAIEKKSRIVTLVPFERPHTSADLDDWIDIWVRQSPPDEETHGFTLGG